jgi:hypothetical protein
VINLKDCGLFIEGANTSIPLKDYHISAHIDNSIGTLDLKQIYINEMAQPIETTYHFPVDPETVVSKMIITVGDKTIESQVQEKEKA